MITLILDGYNVIHGVAELARKMDRSLQTAREGLIGLCQAYKARRGDVGRVYIVFDGDEAVGQGPGAAHGGVTVLFTPKREEADDRIISLIREDAGRSRFVIVSNDNYVFNNARGQGARVMSVSEFYVQTRSVTAVGPSHSEIGDKPAPSSPAAQRITNEYRKRLEEHRRGNERNAQQRRRDGV